MSSFTIYFIIVGLIISLVFHLLKKRVRRKSACFMMYAVRDALILLVAENKISEDSSVFQYYYKNVNMLLENAPNIGIDDIASSIIHLKNNSMEGALKKAEEKSRVIISQKEMKNTDVRGVIEDYYSVLVRMIYAHSSLIRFIYLVLVNNGILPHYVTKVIPDKIFRVIKVLQFADKESSILKKIHA